MGGGYFDLVSPLTLISEIKPRKESNYRNNLYVFNDQHTIKNLV